MKKFMENKLMALVLLVIIVAIVMVANNIFNESDNFKKLVIAQATDAISLDPAITTESESFRVTVNIYDNLVKYSSDGDEILPSLAESWKTSEDGLTWVFHLKKNVEFHDGSSFDARSVEFNFHRWMNFDSPYHTGQFSYYKYNFGGFPGVIRSVTALSDYSVEIVLSKPFAPFLSTLATPAFGIASPDAVMTYNEMYYQHPIGTGPFKYRSWDKGESIVLERNENYFGEKAKLDQVEFRVIASSVDRINLLINNEIHMADNLTSEDIERIDKYTDILTYRRPFFNVSYLALNNNVEPFRDKNVRMAVAKLIDKDDMIKSVFDNSQREASSFLPPVLWGHNENLESYEYDVSQAKKLLREAGYNDDLVLELWVMDSPRAYMSKPIEVANYIKESLKKGGIDVNVTVYKWDEYIEEIKLGNHQMAIAGWKGDNLDPDNFLYTILASENATKGIASNYAFYENDEVDKLLNDARQVTDKEFRKSLYRELQDIVHKDVPSVPLLHSMPTIAARESVIGYVPMGTGEESLEHVDLVAK